MAKDSDTVEYECELAGTEEIADLLRVERRTVNVWRTRGRLPDPYAVISGTPIWLKGDIEAWAKETNRWPADAATA